MNEVHPKATFIKPPSREQTFEGAFVFFSQNKIRQSQTHHKVGTESHGFQ